MPLSARDAYNRFKEQERMIKALERFYYERKDLRATYKWSVGLGVAVCVPLATLVSFMYLSNSPKVTESSYAGKLSAEIFYSHQG